MCKKYIYLTIFCTFVFGLAGGNAHGAYYAAYWDADYPQAWAALNVTTEVRDACEDAGYEILDADQLKTWMDARIADQTPSVVVFCKDIVPDTVAEENSADCTLRKYLDAGGKVVWYSDMPMYYQGHADGSQSGWSESGMANILDIPGTAWTDDTGTTVTITGEGADWGLTTTWTSNRWTPSDDTFTILSTDGEGNTAGYAKHYVPGDTGGGFVRIWDFPVSAIPNIEDILRVAEYGMGGNPFARGPSPADGAMHMDTWVSMSWFAGDFAVSHDVYFGENYGDVEAGTGDTFQGNQGSPFFIVGFPGYPYPDGLVPGTTYYWRIDEVNEADPNSPWMGKIWSFVIPPKKAYDPVPDNGSHFVNSDNLILTWTTGFGSKLHTVYFGDDYDTVANATGGTTQGVASFNPGALEPDKTYYWRVDEFDIVTTHIGDVWSFKTSRVGGGLKGEYFNNTELNGVPILTRIDPQIDVYWNPGPVGPGVNEDNFSVRWTGEMEAPFSEPFIFITGTDDGARMYLNGELIIDDWGAGHDYTEVRSQPIDLIEGQYYSIVVEGFELGGEAEWRLFWDSPSMGRQLVPQGAFSPPIKASSPSPPNGATGTRMTPILRWGSGDYAVSHDVYFGTDADAVANADKSSPEYKGAKALGDESYDPGKLAWHTTYYWRVDEVNDLNPDSPWVGNLWSFTTGDFLVIDDFEDYDAGDNQIWYSWIDGLGFGAPGSDLYNPGNGTGAAVGDETSPSYTEQTIVHSGRQSMPLAYDNNKQGYANYSETELTLVYPRDWTEEGVAELSIWYRGYPASVGSFVEASVGTYTMTASGADIWAVNGVEADEFHFAYKMLTGPGSMVAKVESVENTNVWAKAGVMIRETLNSDSAHAMMVVTPGSGVSFQRRPGTGQNSLDTTTAGITAPCWVKIERDLSGNFTGYHSTNGSTWTTQGTENIPMGSNVYIGLALTSHDAALTCQAVFTNVTTTGTVGPQWSNQDVGILSNAAEPLYVAVSNSTGTPAVVVNDDANATQAATWTEWVIPLSAFTDQGIVLTNVDRIAIGLGTRGMTVPGGSGQMFFDDIRLYRPREAEQQ